jgi:protein TonB
LQRQEEARRQEELARQEQERLEAERRQAQEAEEARLRSEQQANEAATVSPLGVGAAPPRKPAARVSAPASTTGQNTAPVTPKPQPATEAPVTDGQSTAGAVPETVAATPQVQDQSPDAINIREEITAQPESAPAGDAGLPEMIAASQLNRTKYVSPEYPRAARRRNVTGSVDVSFTISTEGRVQDATVVRSEPGDTFDQAAVDAVEQWRFEPIVEDGVAVEKRTAVRLAFDLE